MRFGIEGYLNPMKSVSANVSVKGFVPSTVLWLQLEHYL